MSINKYAVLSAQSFVIFTKAIPKGRPRFSFRTKKSYTPKRTSQFENLLKQEFYAQKRINMHENPIRVSIEFYTKAPTKKLVDQPKPTRPDLDNLIKAVCDAGNGILWKDDSIIYDISAIKKFGKEDKIVVTIF